MKKITQASLLVVSMLVILSFTNMSYAQNKSAKEDIEKVLSPFPKAAEGMVRYVIELPVKKNESLYKVEIIPGKVMSVDCNHHTLIGTLTEETLQGWGYTYYEFKSEGKSASTMMACHKPNEMKFVSGQTMMLRYNSKLPIVVYAPKGFDVKYRIWTAGKDLVSKQK